MLYHSDLRNTKKNPEKNLGGGYANPLLLTVVSIVEKERSQESRPSRWDLVWFPFLLSNSRAASILNGCRSAGKVAANGGAVSTGRARTSRGGGKAEKERRLQSYVGVGEGNEKCSARD